MSYDFGGPGSVSRCKSCGAELRWLRTPRGKLMPTNKDSTESGDTDFDPHRHRSHFADCGQADFWRERNWTQKKAAP